MKKFEGVANTLFVPLVARIAISKEFPEYFYDLKALELEPYLPEGAAKGSSQYSNMASVSRYYNMDKMVAAFAGKYEACNVVYLGAGVDATLPTLLVVSGVFQYFHEEEIVAFIKACGEAFPKGEMIFDATSESGLKFTNWFIKRTGNKNALMYFGINDSKTFAEKCDMELLKVKTFYPDALAMLGKRLNLVTRVSMMVAEKKKQVLILHLKLN